MYIHKINVHNINKNIVKQKTLDLNMWVQSCDVIMIGI